MERVTFVEVVTPLLLATRTEFDAPTWTAYFRALEDVPDRLLVAAVDRAVKSCRFMPKPGELREFAEDARKALRASLVFEPCEACALSPGFVEVIDTGVKRLARCRCWHAHQERVEALNAGPEPLALPAGVKTE